jgi:protein-L-isoaspartate O-methyltransferase
MARMDLFRKRLVSAQQAEMRGVRDPLVLAAMRKAQRVVPLTFKGEAYEDRPLSIGAGQRSRKPIAWPAGFGYTAAGLC